MTGLSLLLGITALAPRPPAVPLITHDPYFSCWSCADHLYDDWPRHWTGHNHALAGLLRVDGQARRFLGGANACAETVTQTSLDVEATQSIYTFTAGGVELTVRFTSPLLPDDLELQSRPASYVTCGLRSTDGAEHDVQLYFDASAEWVVDNPAEAVVWDRLAVSGLDVMRLGSAAQNVLGKVGDDVRIDWGHLLLAVPHVDAAATCLGSADELRAGFCAKGKLLEADDTAMPRAASDRWPVAALCWPLKVGTPRVERHFILAYDDLLSIEYFGQKLPAWWRRHAADAPAGMLRAAEAEHAALLARCDRFDADLLKEAAAIGGDSYARLCALVWRQTMAANKLVAAPDGRPLFFSKECFSNGCIGTVDVTYPSSPFFLRWNPRLLEAQLEPICAFARRPEWKFPFAPHDVGTYPKANGQVYGGGQLEGQMPVEESGNLLIMAAGLSLAGRREFVNNNWDLFTKWAEYLAEHGLDPVNQLCTADMFGHMAHNADLALKAIIGLGGYAQLCAALDHPAEADKYAALARDFAARWQRMAADEGHTRLAYDRPGTWGMKHNLIWDRILGLHLFPDAVGDAEVAWYKKVQGPFGLPCDNRTDTCLIDWAVWCAALARDRGDFEALVGPLCRYAGETPSRVPLSDWFVTTDGRQRGFQARSVVGGVHLPLLLKRGLGKSAGP